MATLNLFNELCESDNNVFSSSIFAPYYQNTTESEADKDITEDNLSVDESSIDLTNFLTKDLVNLIDDSPINKDKQKNESLPSFTLDSDSDGEDLKLRKDSNISLGNKNSSFSTANTLDDKEVNVESNNILSSLKETNTNENTEDKNEKKLFVQREGDWDCMKCKNMNFAFRAHCNRCKCSKVESESLKVQQAKVIASCYQYTQMMQLKMMTFMKMSQIQIAAKQSVSNLNLK